MTKPLTIGKLSRIVKAFYRAGYKYASEAEQVAAERYNKTLATLTEDDYEFLLMFLGRKEHMLKIVKAEQMEHKLYENTRIYSVVRNYRERCRIEWHWKKSGHQDNSGWEVVFPKETIFGAPHALTKDEWQLISKFLTRLTDPKPKEIKSNE